MKKNKTREGKNTGTHVDIAARKQAKAALQESEKRYRLLAENVSDVIWTTDLDLKFTYVSPSSKLMAGYPPEEVMAMNLEQLLTSASLELAKKTLAEELSLEQQGEDPQRSLTLELKHIGKDGSLIWTEAKATFLRDSQGRPVGIQGVSRDISARKRAEEALRKSQESLARFNDCLLGFGNDSDKNIQRLVEVGGEILGADCALYSRLQDDKLFSLGQWQTPPDYKAVDLAEGRICFDVIRQSPDMPLVVRNLQESHYAQSDPNVMRFKLQTYIGTAVHCQQVAVGAICVVYQADIDPNQNDLYLLNIIANAISVEEERKRAEEALREHLYFLQTLIDTIPSPIFYKNVEGIYLGCNKALSDFLGLPKEEIIGKSLYDVYSKDLADKYSEMDAALFRQPGVQIYDFSMDRADGTRRDVNFHKATYSTADGNLAGLVAVMIDITDRKRVEEALLKYEFIANTSKDYMTLINPNYIYEAANVAFCQAHGKTREEVVGTSVANIWEEDRFKNNIKGYLDRCFTGQTVESEGWFEFGKRGRGCFNVFYRPYFNGDGTVAYAAVVSHDITARKRDEKALRESEEKFRNLFNNSGVAMFRTRLDGWETLDINEKFLEIVGRTRAETQGTPSVILWEEQKERDEMVRRLVANGRVSELEFRMLDKQGGVRDCITSLVLYREQGILEGTIIDITERKQAEETLRASEAKYRSLIDNASDGIILANLDGNIVEANRKIEELLDYSKAELLCMNMSQIHPEEDLQELMADFQKVAREGGPDVSTTMILRKDKTKVPVEISGRRVEFGGKTMMQGIFRDISERQKSEAERLRFSKLESLSTLAGGIAHDFNNILTVILGNIGLAMLYSKIGPKAQDKLAKAEQACQRAQALSGQLLTFAKGGAPIKKIVSIANLIIESASLSLSGSKSRCEVSIPDNLWLVEADIAQINQVIGNLLINADQAMPEGGIIKIKAENILVKAKSKLTISKGKYVKLAIVDQGVGISPQYLDKIFDPYFSTKQKGSGLGLATAYSIIKNHSGHIQVESQVGVGTTFYIYLPATDKGVPAAEPETVKPTMGQGKVLVMDDEEMVREVLGGMLNRLGYEVDFASDGSQAIEKYVKAQETHQAFAAVILDLTIPGGMGGKKAIKELLKIDPQVKAIVSSGYSDDPIMADFQKYGFTAVIAKPYNVAELGKVLNDVLTGKE